MSENPQEQTEAKLLAFIEGELDEAGRADIARHLEANPKHRRLLDDLAAGRRLLRQLPRESAPAEVFEGFESQLERHVLLSNPASAEVNPETGNYKLHHRRWVKIRAAAAAVILLTGIGIVVVKSLPDRSGPTVARSVQPPPSDSTPALGGNERSESDPNGIAGENHFTEEQNKQAAAPHLLKSKGSANPEEPIARGRELAKGTTPTDKAEFLRQKRDENRFADNLKAIAPEYRARMALAADEARQLPALRELLEKPADRSRGAAAATPLDAASKPAAEIADTSGHEPLFLVVASNDPQRSRKEVTELLNEQNATFFALDGLRRLESRNNAALADQDFGTGRPEEKFFRGQAASKPAANVAAAAKPVSPAEATPSIAAVPQATAPQPAGRPSESAGAGGRAPQAAMQVPAAPAPAMATATPPPAAPAPPVTPPTQPAGPIVLSPAPAFDLHGERLAAATAPSDARVIIVRKMSRSQAAKLAESLNRPTAAQFAATYRGYSPSPSRALAANMGAAVEQENVRAMERNPAADRRGVPPATLPQHQVRQAEKAMAEAPLGVNRAGGEPATAPDANAPIAGGDRLVLVLPKLKGRAVPVRVAADGTIYVLDAGSVPVAGLTPAQATERVAQALQQKNAKSEGVVVRRPTPAELSVASDGSRVEDPISPEKPVQVESLQLQPAAVAPPVAPRSAGEPQTGSDPADSLVDVVIVLQEVQVDPSKSELGTMGRAATAPAVTPPPPHFPSRAGIARRLRALAHCRQVKLPPPEVRTATSPTAPRPITIARRMNPLSHRFQ